MRTGAGARSPYSKERRRSGLLAQRKRFSVISLSQIRDIFQNCPKGRLRGTAHRSICIQEGQPAAPAALTVHVSCFAPRAAPCFRDMNCPDLQIRCPSEIRGRRESRAPTAPVASCAAKKAHELATTGSAVHSRFPRAMVLAACFVLSPVSGLFCHRRQRDHLRRNAIRWRPQRHPGLLRRLSLQPLDRNVSRAME